jgi:hypothetical protein
MSKTLKNNTKNGFSPIFNISAKEIAALKTKKTFKEEPDFTLKDKEWISKIDPKKIAIKDIL